MSYNGSPWGLLQKLEGSIWELWLGRVVPDETHKVQHLHFTYRKVGSSRLVYYSIFNHFWGATNWDVLLTETCYYYHVQKSIKWLNFFVLIKSNGCMHGCIKKVNKDKKCHYLTTYLLAFSKYLPTYSHLLWVVLFFEN